MHLGRHAIPLFALAAFAWVSPARAQAPPLSALPLRDVPPLMRAEESFRSRSSVADARARGDVFACTSAVGLRVRTRGRGTIEATFARAEAGGLRLSDYTGGDRGVVSWDEIVRADIRKTRERTSMEGFERGWQIGALAGVAVALIATRRPGGIGDLAYPIAVVAVALPCAAIGGVIGMAAPGQITTWDRCWP